MSVRSYLLAIGAVATLVLGSCKDNNGKSLSELKSEQSDAIDAFAGKNNLSFTELSDNALPSNASTGIFYKLKNGLYLRVDSWGDLSKKAELNKTTVYVQLKGYQFSKAASQANAFDNYSKPSIPEIEFNYVYYYSGGDIHYNLVSNKRPVGNYDILMCQGLAFPVSLGLGDGAELSLIVPFEIGPSSTYSSGWTTYVEKIRYTFE